jgi:hypothetical protein
MRLPETGSPENPLWTAMTEGEEQEIVVERLSTESSPWSVDIAKVSHIEAAVTATTLAQAVGYGTSQPCQVDIVCVIQSAPSQLKPSVSVAAEAVAVIATTDATGSTGYCTGTLLNSANYPAPFLYTAAHCVHDAASVASLTTFWFWERDTCAVVPPSTRATQVAGGAIALFVSSALDSMDSALVLLNNAPPPGAHYSGWDSSVIPSGSEILAIHHPSADVKKGSFGNMIGPNPVAVPIPEWGTMAPGTFYEVLWQVGIVEPGSSGSGLFTYNAGLDAFVTRGTLTAVAGSCNVATSIAYYSPLSRAYPFISNALSVKVTPGQLQLPAPVNFPAQPVGTQSAPITLTVTNVGGSPVTVSSVQGSDPAEFPATTNCVGSGPAGASCQITMSFQPSSAGLRTQTVTIVSNGVGSPQAFQVSGMGSTATTSFAPTAGVWWNKNEPGSGLGIDYQNGMLIAEVYSYLGGGPSQWYLSAGPIVNNVYTGTLDKYIGGQCISCSYVAPTLVGNDGTITITFTSPTTATVDLPGGRHIQIERYFGSPGAAAPPGSFTPLGGVWWNPQEPGSGYGLDYQNGTLIVEDYSYLANSGSQWYLAAGPVTNNVFTATLDKYVGGQCISCTYRASALAGNDGTITITFTSATTANVTLPSGRQIQIQRYFR